MQILNHRKFKVIVSLLAMTVLLASCGGGAKIPDTYNYDDLSQFLKIGEYEGLSYKLQSTKVTEAEIQSKIDSNLDAAATTKEVTSGEITDTSVLNVDYVGSVDGKEFEGGKAEGAAVDIANSSYIDGFAESMVGHQVGENFDIYVTFPENYGAAELAGKDAVFNITVNSMTVKETPKFDDAFVKANSDFKTTDEYKKDIEDSLKAEKERAATENARQELFLDICEDSNIVEYPEKELKAAKDDMIDTYKSAASANGMSYEDFVTSQFGMDAEEFEKQVVQVSAENMVKQELVIRVLAEKEGLKFTDKDYDDFVMSLLDEVGLTKDEFKSNYGTTIYEYADAQNLYGSMLYERVMDVIISKSVAK